MIQKPTREDRQNWNADQYVEWIKSDQFNVSTAPGEAVFWSGNYFQVSPDDTLFARRFNVNAADKELTGDDQRQRVEHTEGGKEIFGTYEKDANGKIDKGDDLEKKFGNGTPELERVCDAVSEKFAQEVSGDVATRVVGAGELRVFRRIELETLLENEKVTSVNGVAREELKDLYDQDPKAAFQKICESEIGQRREHATDAKTAREVDKAEDFYRSQMKTAANDSPEPEHREKPTVEPPPVQPQAANNNVEPSHDVRRFSGNAPESLQREAANNNNSPPEPTPARAVANAPANERTEVKAVAAEQQQPDLRIVPPPPPPPPPPSDEKDQARAR